jgi:hypothetical protein
VPLIARIDTMGTGLFIPSHKAEPTREAHKVLAQPISKDFESSKARIETRRSGKAIPSTDLTNRPPRQSQRRQTHSDQVANDAAPATVERLAGKLAEILKGPTAGARDVRHDDDQPWEGRTPPRKQSRTRQRLVMQFKPCGAYENASGDDDRGP